MQSYEDDYLPKDGTKEMDHLNEEYGRITDLLKKELPKVERMKQE